MTILDLTSRKGQVWKLGKWSGFEHQKIGRYLCSFLKGAARTCTWSLLTVAIAAHSNNPGQGNSLTMLHGGKFGRQVSFSLESQVTTCVKAVGEGFAAIFPERRSAFGSTLKNLQVSFRSKGILPGKSNLTHFSENQP